MTVQHCRAKDPTTCKYHGAEIRAEKALSRGKMSAYLAARREMEEHRGIGRAEEAAFLPSADTATPKDITNDRNHLIVDYPTESTYDSSWSEEGYTDIDNDIEENNDYTRFNITGNLAQRVLNKVGKPAGQVTLTEATMPYWLSELTGEIDYAFTVEVDGEKVWDSADHNAYVYPTDKHTRPKDSFSLSYIGHLNNWLNA